MPELITMPDTHRKESRGRNGKKEKKKDMVWFQEGEFSSLSDRISAASTFSYLRLHFLTKPDHIRYCIRTTRTSAFNWAELERRENEQELKIG